MNAQDQRFRLLRFGVFELDLERRELRRRGLLVPLPPQPLAILERLAFNEGRIVTREELRRVLWPDGVHVDHERGLNYCVNRVRRALGDTAQTPRFVETLPRRGYRFLASVDRVAEPISDAATSIAPSTRSSTGPMRRAPLAQVAAAVLALVLQSAGVARQSTAGQPGLPSRDPAAQAAFQMGRRLLDEGPTGWRRSVDWFTEAARRDDGFALARYGLADAYMRLGEQGILASQQAFPAARDAVLGALAIEERAEPLVILAALKLNYDWDWAGSERAVQRALALDPELTMAWLLYARLLSAAGRHAEALAAIGEAERRHPASSQIVRDAAFVNYRAHRFDAAARRFRDWAELEPSARDPHHWMALLHHLRGRTAEAVPEARRVLTLAGTRSRYLEKFDSLAPGPAMEFYLRGCIHYLQDQASSQWVTSDDIARLRAQLGERDGALDDLQRAADERSPRLLPYLTDPAFTPLRSDPRFQALLLRVRAPGLNRTQIG